jgi:hypothetical protein
MVEAENFSVHPSNFHGCVTDKAVILRLFTSDACIRCQESSYGICGGRSGTRRDFCAYFGFALAVTIPPMLHICHLHYVVYVLTVSLGKPQIALKLKTTIYRSYEPCREHIRGRSVSKSSHDATSRPGTRADWRRSNAVSHHSRRTRLESRLFCLRLCSYWGLPRLLYCGQRVFPGGKKAGAWR